MVRFLVFLLVGFPLLSAAGALPLRTVTDVPLPGQVSRLDYATFDPITHLLFIAHLGDSSVVVYDTRLNKVVRTLSGIGHVHGVLAIPELGRVYASATATDEIVVIDEASLEVVARIPGGVYPDGMAFDPGHQKLYVSDEHGKTETVIDVHHNQRVATIPLGSEAGNSQYDAASGHIFVSAQSTAEWLEIDPGQDKVLARHALPDCTSPHGLAIDARQRLAFIACQDNARLLTVDMRRMEPVASHDLGKDPDVLVMDPDLQRLTVASEQGVVSVFTLNAETKPIGEGVVDRDAHSLAIDVATHRLYFPLMNVGGHPVLRIMAESP